MELQGKNDACMYIQQQLHSFMQCHFHSTDYYVQMCKHGCGDNHAASCLDGSSLQESRKLSLIASLILAG